MISKRAGLNSTLKDALDTINLDDMDRRLAAARLARSEYAVDLLFAAGNAVATLIISLVAGLRHVMTSSRSWFAH